MASPRNKPRLVLNLALGDASSTSPFNAQDHWLKIHWEIIRYLSLNMSLPLMSTAHFFLEGLVRLSDIKQYSPILQTGG